MADENDAAIEAAVEAFVNHELIDPEMLGDPEETRRLLRQVMADVLRAAEAAKAATP